MRNAVLVFVLILGEYWSAPAFATDDHHTTPPKTVIIEHRDHGDAAAGALIGAGITYWLVQRHKKRDQRPIVILPQNPLKPECSAQVDRVLEACGVSK